MNKERAIKRRLCRSTSARGSLSFEVMERELLQAYDRMLHADCPNPQRVGCPRREVLEKAATSIEFVTRSLLEHLGRCAPCSDELRELNLRARVESKHSSD